MVTRELIKEELEKVPKENLGILFKIVKALEEPTGGQDGDEGWPEFVAATYGSLAGAPMERGDQGDYDSRLPLE